MEHDARPASHRASLSFPFRLDLRSLAAFRIGLGLLILIDLAVRAQDLTLHYTDAGLLPRAFVVDARARPVWFSLYFAVGDFTGTATLFALQAALAALLVLGVRTRLVTFASWIMMTSLQSRNPLVLNAGDTLFRMCLFWSMFLPLGARFSLDARRRPATAATDVVSAGTVAYVLQLCFVYWFSAALKSGEAWADGSALYYALHIDMFARPAALWLREVEWLLPPLTYLAHYWEWLGPILLFIPLWNDRCRLLAIGGFLVFHAAILAVFAIGLFPVLCVVAWVPIVPGRAWRAFEPPTPLPSHPTTLRGARATLAHRGAAALALCALLYVLAWNLSTLTPDGTLPYISRRWNLVADFIRLDQRWDMFSPAPPRRDGWYVKTGTLDSGEEVDLDTGQPVTWRKPPLVVATVPNRRWGKLLMQLREPEGVALRHRYARHVAREWNTTHDERKRIHTVALFFVEELAPAEAGPARPPERLWYERLGDPVDPTRQVKHGGDARQPASQVSMQVDDPA